MKHIFINQAVNGFSVNVASDVERDENGDLSRVDHVDHTFVFNNAKEVVDFVSETLKEVKEEVIEA